ncbi:PEP/pyruvate-binding domain-containing protein [Halobacillus litoralis]|uniref:PEP/pyruvate-binding domain-containing protein n=1 Tax=Halobacillus litoralis TaxID=45668 RepID=UPI001CFE8875|nr:PEP/pyruvate-binding domain-containing protein [Halobacillus litoralis]
MSVVPLQEASSCKNEWVGSKAMNLSKTKKIIPSIPDGFVVTSEIFKAFLIHNDLESSNPDIQEDILNGHFSESMKEEISAHYAELVKDQPTHVAVRSSSASEDLEGASFAGQYETMLNIRNEEELLQSIKKCWASYFSAYVQDYASLHNVSLENLHMGVLVQQMVAADVSGVIFSSNPVTHNHQEVLVNASYGLGETIVDGTVTPDMFIVHKEENTITKELGLKEIQTIQTEEGNETIDVPETWQDLFSLNDSNVLEIVSMTKEIELYYGLPVDIEFAMKDNHIHILQTRPITTMKESIK